MEISYKKVGDYYIPEMVFPNAKPDKNIGKYGRLRLNYLKHNHMDIYTILLMDDKLNEHLLEIEKEAKEQVKILVENMCKKENVTEKLKENNQMEWVKLMNNFKIIAEEIVDNNINIQKIFDEADIENGLSKEECKMLSKIIILNYKLQEIEENEIYFKGGMDAYFYFRKLGILK